MWVLVFDTVEEELLGDGFGQNVIHPYCSTPESVRK
jgi:hypothetical protein